VGGETIRVHRFIVSVRSPYFKAALSTAVGEQNGGAVEFKTKPVELVKQAINYMYGIDIEEGITDYWGLFDIAEFLMMEDFKKEVDWYTMFNAKIDKNNLVEMCQLAEDWQAAVLAVRCAGLIVGTSDFPLEKVAKMPVVMAAAVRLARGTVQVARKTKEENKTCGKLLGKELAKYTESLTGPVEGDEAPAAAAQPAPGGGAVQGSKYVPPSRRGAGGSAGMSDAQARVQGGDMMPDRRREDTAAIRVSNLSENAQETDLQELFKPFGHIARIFLAKDKMTGQCKGFAFVNYYRKEDAAKAIATLNGFGYDHLILSVEWAKPAQDR